MIQRLAVFSSDQVNRLGYQMPIGTLSAALDQGWEAGQPLFLSHDRHRLEGWTRALGLHLEPGMARLTGLCFVPEDESESEKLKESLLGSWGVSSRPLSSLTWKSSRRNLELTTRAQLNRFTRVARRCSSPASLCAFSPISSRIGTSTAWCC